MVGSHVPTREEWVNNPLATGTAVYSLVRNSVRPRWAGDILATCCDRMAAVPDAVQRVLGLALDESHWVLAHDAFTDVRHLTLSAQRADTEGSYHYLLTVAENAAKVIYNASGAPAPFDKDCGAWLVRWTKQFADRENNVEFTERLWQVVLRYTQISAS